MAEVALAVPSGEEVLDLCTSCQFIWFDDSEYSRIPMPQTESAPKETLSKADRIEIGRAKAALLKASATLEMEDSQGPESGWEILFAALGLIREESNPSFEFL